MAATLVVVHQVWRNFRACRQVLSSSDLAEIKWPAFGICATSVLVYGTILAMGWFGVEIVQSVVILAMLAFSGMALIVMAIILVWRLWRACRTRKWPTIQWSSELDLKQSQQVQYLLSGAALFNLLMVLILAIGAMAGAMDVSLGTQVSTQAQEDFDMSKWMLRAAIPGFGIGLFMIAAGAFFDIWSNENQRGKDSP